ncbi:hypothetical protein HCB18_27170 [Salinispora arenicola]|uniref:hypothetical protein n=1 Tax=Salinispora arenicola TaxID=168697 RepID=UPI00169C6BDF|nr:hypothetical protein [Salinispora arenicola]NIL60027.1 hypothetical protein [Salinispora arenicola]
MYLTLGTLVANNHSEDLAHEITKLESDIEDKKKEIANAEGQLSNLPSREDLFQALDNARKAHGAAVRAEDDLLKESGSNANQTDRP